MHVKLDVATRWLAKELVRCRPKAVLRGLLAMLVVFSSGPLVIAGLMLWDWLAGYLGRSGEFFWGKPPVQQILQAILVVGFICTGYALIALANFLFSFPDRQKTVRLPHSPQAPQPRTLDGKWYNLYALLCCLETVLVACLGLAFLDEMSPSGRPLEGNHSWAVLLTFFTVLMAVSMGCVVGTGRLVMRLRAFFHRRDSR